MDIFLAKHFYIQSYYLGRLITILNKEFNTNGILPKKDLIYVTLRTDINEKITIRNNIFISKVITINL